MNHVADRRERLARLLPEEGLDALLISNAVNVTYLTGFTGDSSVVVLTRDRAILISDPRYTGQIADECPGLETHIRPPTKRIGEAAAEVLTKLGLRAVGFESGVVTMAEFEYLKELAPTVEWKGVADRVERMRMVKDDDELGRIRGAIAVAERAFTALCALIATGRHRNRVVRRDGGQRPPGRRPGDGVSVDRRRRRPSRPGPRAADGSARVGVRASCSSIGARRSPATKAT